MTEVLVKCPVTGLGLDACVTEEELLTEISSLAIHTVNCPHCYTIHTWRKKDAYLDQGSHKVLPGQ